MAGTEQDDTDPKVLPEELAEHLRAKGRGITVRKGAILIGHADEAREVFLIESGSAQVSIHSHDGKETIFRDIGENEMFGEMAAIDGAPRSATVVATSDMRLSKISASAFEEWLEDTRGAGVWLARLLVSRMRDLTERNFELATMTVMRRIHLELMRLAAGKPDEGNAVTIDDFPTHADFAARIGTHREAVSRELSWLRDNGLIATKSRSLRILDIDRLKNMAMR